MNNIEQIYLDHGYTIVEIEEGVYYVQKQKATRSSEERPMHELRDEGRDDLCSPQQPIEGWEGEGD